MMRVHGTRIAAVLLALGALSACASKHRVPDWAVNEQGAAERAT